MASASPSGSPSLASRLAAGSVTGVSSAVLKASLAASGASGTGAGYGGVATQIAESARMPTVFSPEKVASELALARKVLRMSPAQAGEIIVQGVERREKRLLVTGEAKFLALLERMAPVWHADVFHWLVRRVER